jgi:hypothetical protein
MTEGPWENENGSTNVDGFLAAYAEDDNTFWRTDHGHIMNVLDAVLDRLADEQAHADRLYAAGWHEATCPSPRHCDCGWKDACAAHLTRRGEVPGG